MNFGGSENFIVRNVRFRIGQKDAQGNILAENACGAENCTNFIFDHCTFGWSVEENMNVFDSHFHTVQYCIVHEGLYNAGHSKGARGYGCQWGGSPATYHHNLLAHNNSRSCRFNGSPWRRLCRIPRIHQQRKLQLGKPSGLLWRRKHGRHYRIQRTELCPRMQLRQQLLPTGQEHYEPDLRRPLLRTRRSHVVGPLAMVHQRQCHARQHLGNHQQLEWCGP